ncbi:MAG: threonine synthase [Eubacterium sp.]|nr:threonine synthase [Eubacterium sp.]
MNYKSTRDINVNVTAAGAISKGLSADGGLFVPDSIPQLSKEKLLSMCDMSYADRAYEVFRLFLNDFTDDEIRHCVNSAYSDKNFATENIAELSHLLTGTYMLELWHGPTCAFKDMALQILPFLLTCSAKKTIDGKKIMILVATSGDTGKAALEGFKDVDGTSIMVFYPEDGVSNMQKRQMTTQEGNNVNVCAVVGNFDDCQNGVKAIFTDEEILAKLEDANTVFSSANSINWGRLAPQIVYYVSSYVQLVKDKEIEYGEKVNVCVPTGNFGNILAAYYAKQMGVPIGKLICASNANNILTDFINTGIYDRNRPFYTTVSPSMDILISSNLERLLYHLTDEDDKLINEWFGSLKASGRYEVNDAVKQKIKDNFYAGCCDDAATKETIKKVFEEYGYLCDTHTAVAYKVYEEYKKATGDDTKTIVVSTANPYKFGYAVYDALGGKDECADEFELIAKLEQLTNTTCPKALADTKNKEIRFTGSAATDKMSGAVLDFLKAQEN